MARANQPNRPPNSSSGFHQTTDHHTATTITITITITVTIAAMGLGDLHQTTPVKAWKEEHGLKHFFNTPGSPDLSPIENCWRAVKQYVKANRYPGSDLRLLILEGWRRIDQTSINKPVDSMVVRMQDVLACEGQMTGW